VLVIRLDEIGDLVLTSPFLRELRRNLPDAEIDILVKRENVAVVENCPYVNRVRGVPVGRHPYFGRLQRSWTALTVARSLRGRDYDLALVPRWDSDYFYNAAALAYLSGARWRVGQRERLFENRSSDSMFTNIIDNASLQHEVERNLEVLRGLGITPRESGLEYWLTERDDARAMALLETNGVAADTTIIVIAPSASHPRKRWPIDNYAAVVEWIQRALDAHVVVVGGADDRSLSRAMTSGAKRSVLDLTGKTSLTESAAVIRRAHVYIGNDSGPLHIAAALGVPTVGIWCHPTSGLPDKSQSPTRFHPWGNESLILQPASPTAPCDATCESEVAHCIRQVTPGRVIEAVESLLRVRQQRRLG
jgi:heptosyltransferase-2